MCLIRFWFLALLLMFIGAGARAARPNSLSEAHRPPDLAGQPSASHEKTVQALSHPIDYEDTARGKYPGGHFKVKKKYKKFIIPLLLAYKLKFFTLIPIVIGGLVLLSGATGLAGFFFALFAASMGLKSGGYHH